jgi:outer membrane protein
MTKPALITLVMLLAFAACAAADALDDYVEEGLENNLALKQADFSLAKSRAALREARSRFLPSIGVRARYTHAGGGRDFEFPVGDFVNPIHEALNQLIGQDRFPTDVPNITTPLLREREHETKIEAVQPIFQPAIYYNCKISSNLASAEEAAREVFKQDLVLEIKTAYYTYLKAVELVTLAEKTEEVLRENVRVSRSLFENGKVTKDAIYRAQAELSETEQQRAEAVKGETTARAYFNFLLNRPLDMAVMATAPVDLPVEPLGEPGEIEAGALARRYEPARLRSGLEAARNGVRLSRAEYLPDLLLVYDYGYQGEIYRFGPDDDFWAASLVLQWDVFSGLGRKARVDQARAEERRLAAQLEEAKQSIRLEVRQGWESLRVGRAACQAALDRVDSATKSFEIVSAKYREGMAAHIEYLDARVAMTRAQVNLIVTKFDYHIKYAEYERAIGRKPSGSP